MKAYTQSGDGKFQTLKNEFDRVSGMNSCIPALVVIKAEKPSTSGPQILSTILYRDRRPDYCGGIDGVIKYKA